MLRQWNPTGITTPPLDLVLIEETALAMAQATIANAMDDAAISRAELARQLDRPRSFVTRILSGDHNLTVKTFARALAACGYQLGFHPIPLHWAWGDQSPPVAQELDGVSDESYQLAA